MVKKVINETKVLNSAVKRWEFTLNNYTDKDESFFQNMTFSYLCYGREKCPTTNTKHLQGTIIFNRSYRLTQLKKLHVSCHWEISKTTDSENYCKKDGDFFEKDNRVGKGKRTDLSLAAEVALKEGLKEVAAQYPEQFVKFGNGLSNLIQIQQPDRDFEPVVFWLYGSTGLGKTRLVYDAHGKSTSKVWKSPPTSLDNWSGYENQHVCILDDFRDSTCKFSTLLQILDRYPLDVNVKYGHRKLNSHFMYVTSPLHPSKVFNTDEDINQLLRRIGKGKNVLRITKSNYKDSLFLILRQKIIRELELSSSYKGCFVQPFDFRPIKKYIPNPWYLHNQFMNGFKKEFKNVKLLSTGLFNFNSS